MERMIEIWADSFHEGKWFCDNISHAFSRNGYSVSVSFLNGFQPKYVFKNKTGTYTFIVFGSYRSWSPIPSKINEVLCWGKPDFIAYDPSQNKVIFAVEETAATPTGNQAMQRCERQYGSARFHIPYWYLISEYGRHGDGGIRRDSIWPSIAAIKLSIFRKTPCVVLHYSDVDNPEDYQSGSGVGLLFTSLFKVLSSHLSGLAGLECIKDDLQKQYSLMLQFIKSQWHNIVDFLPGESDLNNPETANQIAHAAVGNSSDPRLQALLHWPLTKEAPTEIQQKWHGKELIKFDPLCFELENDITNGKAYYLSDNAGSGRPPTTEQIQEWISAQNRLFSRTDKLSPPAKFSMDISDFPITDETGRRRHLTTAKNIVYLYDSWNAFVVTVAKAYPRLKDHIKPTKEDPPVFVYVSNSIKPGRLFGDPFTGQLAAYSTAFGKFDKSPRKVVAYFPHQCHTQAILRNRQVTENKGLTLMSELTDCIIFHAGVAVSLKEMKVF